MFVACASVVVVVSLAVSATALRKLTRSPGVVAEYALVGVAERHLPVLAAILLAGAAGSVAGLRWTPIGIAASVGLTAYFVLAVAAHLRAGDHRHVAPPIVLLAASAVALILRAVTA